MSSPNLTSFTKKIRNYYGNHKTIHPEDGPTITPVGTAWNWRLVVMKEEGDSIKKLMAENGADYENRKEWLQHYQLAANTVIETLGGRDVVKEKYGEIAAKWNSSGISEEERAKYVFIFQPVLSGVHLDYRTATKSSGKAIDSFLKKMDSQMGVAIVGFAAYRDEAGKLKVFKFVFIVQLLSDEAANPPFSFCTEDSRSHARFPLSHSSDVESFLDLWGDWVAQNGMYPCPLFFISSH